MPRMAQGTRWGFNSCLQSPPAPLSPSPFNEHVQFPAFTDKAPQHAENSTSLQGLRLLGPITCIWPGRHHANLLVQWWWKTNFHGGCPHTPRDWNLQHKPVTCGERPWQPGGNYAPIQKHLGHLNINELFQSLSKHFNCLGGSFKRGKTPTYVL